MGEVGIGHGVIEARGWGSLWRNVFPSRSRAVGVGLLLAGGRFWVLESARQKADYVYD